MVKRVVFLAGPCGREVWMWKLFEELKKREEVVPHFIALRQKDVDFFKSKGFSDDQITKIFSLEEGPKPDNSYLQECEKKYGLNIWDLWNITLARDKKREKIPERVVLSYFQNAFEKSESIVKKFNPDYYLCYGVAGYDSAIFTEVFRKQGVKTLELVAAIMPNRFTFAEDLSNIWPSLVKRHEELKAKGLLQEERRKAKEFIENFRNKPLVPDCAKGYEEPVTNKIHRYKRYAQQVLRYRKLPSNLRFIFWPVIQKYYDVAGFFEKPVEGEKIVLFPLHFQPEATTLIYGKWYVEQATLIENIAKALPLGYSLYVKEHPFGYGNRSPAFYKRIKRLPNVRLIGPRVNNFALLKESSLLTTITGTSGWEALLLGKQAITFGNVFYNVCEVTKRVKNLEDLPQLVKSSLDKKIDDEKLILFVAALQSCSYPGLARLPSDCKNKSLEDENIKLLADGVLDYISKG